MKKAYWLLSLLLAAVLIFAACTEEPTQNDAQPPVDGKQNTQDDTPVTPVRVTLPDDIKKITVSYPEGEEIRFSYTSPDKIKALCDYYSSLELDPVLIDTDLTFAGLWVIYCETPSDTVALTHMGNRLLSITDGESGNVYNMGYEQSMEFSDVLRANTPDVLPDKYENIIFKEWRIPSKISIYRDNGSTPDFAYITDPAEILGWYDAFKPESLVSTTEQFWGSSEQERYYIDFGNGYGLIIYADDNGFFCCIRVDGVDYRGDSISVLIEDAQTYTVSEDAQQKLKALFESEAYPSPDKVVMYYYGDKKEITDPNDVQWWYNALKHDALNPDGTSGCRCGSVYYIEFGNGYALSAHAHADAYHVGTGISVAGSTAGLLGDTRVAYSVPESVHQKLKDLFK
ncbi:MAG: hypothetical protein IJE90_08990 [Clostridia bacterium]|nr:hypothetical protein [Clostridia bacterium]